MSARLKLKKANDRIKGAMLAAQNAEHPKRKIYKYSLKNS